MPAVPDLIPARMLNEFTYCPRLAYLEWVQSEFAHNTDTLEGRFGHRRADREDEREIPAPASREESDADTPADEIPFESIHARSVMLSAPGEGLIAKIDILEVEGDVATPVDYKRGKAPDLPEGAFEPERVQLCAQALILREYGYRCDSGVIYFIASKKRVPIEFDELLIMRTRELIDEMRAMAGNDRIPLPLVDSPKCPRCSLVGICLPDETHFLADTPQADPIETVRRLIPARDDALPMYVQLQGGHIGKSGERLSVKLKGDLLQDVRLHDISQLCIFGNVQITTQAIHELIQREIPICYFTYGGWFRAMTHGLTHKNVELRIAQFATAADPAKSLPFAKAFIRGKIINSRTMLRRHLDPDPDNIVDRLADLTDRVDQVDSAESLLGIEGTAARLYFSGFAKLVQGGETFRFEDRNRRPPRDPINAVLSFLYSMLAKEWTVILASVGFDPMLGFFHRPRYGRPALALDMAEEFRPLVAESVALTLVNTGELSGSHFVSRAGACSLTESGRKITIGAFERRLDTLITHPLFGYRVSYRRIFEVQARLLARTLSEELPKYPNFLTR